MLLPSGSNSIRGAEIKEYISDANGMPEIDKIPNKKTTLSNLDLSSKR